ncbi:tetraspanin-9-like protein [Leptotrombidium deliense]|uniref:Tetraspanin n=1 Tax=Leptotrombidium deliense TaxID=299467 RepID=A0A443SC62_9ACAR|nr:tetraspanin-9-like protein [Leptotrombidium deliense]
MTILIAFCGCCGAWFQSKCLLGTFLGFMVIVLLLQIIAGILGFVFRQSIRDTLKEELIDGIKSHYNNESNGLVTAWDQVQGSLHCCGVNSYKDWYKSNAWPNEDWVPASCCIVNNTISDSDYICGRNLKVELPLIKTTGCYSRIKRWLLDNLHFIGIACVVFAFVQFFSIVSSLIVICTMDYKRQYRPANGDYRSTYNRVPTL